MRRAVPVAHVPVSRRFFDSESEAAYARLYEPYKQLCREVQYILQMRLRSKNIEVAQIAYRVKSLKSLTEKAERKNYFRPLQQSDDIAGVRVVCLYTDDVPRVCKLVADRFEVLESVTKAASGVDQFGYSAQHFVVSLKREESGARFDELKALRCEIQVRTVMQDAWAIVDHHLRYKSESEVPAALTHSIHSLAAVLEVADKQFNDLRRDRTAYLKRLSNPRRSWKNLLNEDLNRDSLQAYLQRKFPGFPMDVYARHLKVVLENLDLTKYRKLGDLEGPLAATAKVRKYYKRDIYSHFSASQLALALGCVDAQYRRDTYFGDEARAVIKRYLAAKRKSGRRKRESTKVKRKGLAAKRKPEAPRAAEA